MIDLKIKFTKIDGSEQTLQVRPLDQVKFEEKYNVSFLESFDEGSTKVSYVYFLAYCAADSADDFHTFVGKIKTIDDVLVDGESVFAAAQAAADAAKRLSSR